MKHTDIHTQNLRKKSHRNVNCNNTIKRKLLNFFFFLTIFLTSHLTIEVFFFYKRKITELENLLYRIKDK